MPVEKFSISLPQDLTIQVDDLARAEGVTRSALIREATADYVSARRFAARETERRARVDAALTALDAVAAGWGADERSVLDLLAEVRGEAGDAAQEPGADAGTDTDGG